MMAALAADLPAMLLCRLSISAGVMLLSGLSFSGAR